MYQSRSSSQVQQLPDLPKKSCKMTVFGRVYYINCECIEGKNKTSAFYESVFLSNWKYSAIMILSIKSNKGFKLYVI